MKFDEFVTQVFEDTHQSGFGRLRHWLFDPARQVEIDPAYPISNLFFYIWRSRLDLQQVFDLTDSASRISFCEWLLLNGSSEYGIRGWAYPPKLLRTLSKQKGLIGQRARQMLDDCDLPASAGGKLDELLDGANLVGYARGEFGMGEHIRAAAKALQTVEAPFSIVSLSEAGVHGAGERSAENWISNQPNYATNIFHVNADILPTLYGRFGPSFFERRYNIGYWAWELAKCPDEFVTAISMMDEIWGISEFVTEAFRGLAGIPVIRMPIAVELPKIIAKFEKGHFGFDEDDFVFLFTFDAASYLDRKNPLAVIRAFTMAFPRKSERVRLLLKTMNVPSGDPRWAVIANEAANDRRITILDQRLQRSDVLGMYLACDAFISLHRSEGFGRCIAEAMLLGKPVIATGYSGSNEFVKQETACVVDYRLIPVERGSYPFSKNQLWAEPDVEQAASFMQKIVVDHWFRRRIAQAGQAFVRDNFNARVVGTRYLDRLDRIRSSRLS